MNTQAPSREPEPLITPNEAAQRLLEAATRAAVRTGGAAGLRPIVVEGRHMFRLTEVDALATVALAA